MSEQAAQVSGHGNLIIQIAGHGNTVLAAPPPSLKLLAYDTSDWTTPMQGEAGEAGYTAAGQREVDLLSPYTRSFELRGREALLAQLGAWLEGAGVSVQVLTGPGGRGKTRMAVELCRQAREKGWLAGFAAGDEMARFRRQNAVGEWNWTKPLLVVVDYAAAKADQIGDWLGDLLHHAAINDSTHPPLRLLLLERQGDRGAAWWRRLVKERNAERLIALDAPLALPPIEDPVLRWAIFAEGYARATKGAAPARDERLDGELGRVSAGGEPLFLGMFGLIAARIGLNAAMGLASDEVALRMADEELRRIRKVWSAGTKLDCGDADLPGLLAALATLGEGWSAKEAKAAIRAECAELGLEAHAPEPLRAALHAALPGEAGRTAPAVPNILRGSLGSRAFAALGDKGLGAIGRARASNTAAVTRSVIRACQDFVIRGQRAPLEWLGAVRANIEDLEGLAALVNAMPHQTLELRELATEITGTLVSVLRGLVKVGLQDFEDILAANLNNYSNRLSAVGREQDALSAISEAVGLREKHARAGTPEHMAALAGALSNQANRMSTMGQIKQAIPIFDRSANLFCRLNTQYPEKYNFDLALVFRSKSDCLAKLAEHNQALAAIEKSISYQLNGSNVHTERQISEIAYNKKALSRRLSAVGKRKEAVAAAEDSVLFLSQLATMSPDTYLEGLASSLHDLSVALYQAGYRNEALAISKKSVASLRQMAHGRPKIFRGQLALALNNLSVVFTNLGYRSEAISPIQESVDILRSISERTQLGVALLNLARVLLDAGRPDDSLPIAKEAVELLNGLPTNSGAELTQQYLANAFLNLGRSLAAVHKFVEAVDAIRESIKINGSIIADRPTIFLPDFASALNNLALLLGNLHEYEEAFLQSDKAIKIQRVDADLYPTIVGPLLAASLHTRSGLLLSVSQNEGALSAVTESIHWWRQSIAQNAGDFRSSLASSLGTRASILLHLGQYTDAAKGFEEGINLLHEPFLAMPAAFAPVMASLCPQYLKACDAAGLTADFALLGSIMNVLRSLPSKPHPPPTET